MMVRFSTDDEVESMTEGSKGGWQIDVRASNGTVMFHGTLKSCELEEIRHMSNKMDRYDWVVLFYKVCFRQLAGDDSKRYELNARLERSPSGGCRMSVDINVVLGKSTATQLRQKLGGFTLDEVSESEVDEEYDLFTWTREICQNRDHYMDEVDRLERGNKKLRTQLDEFMAQEQLSVDKLVEQEEHQLMVFTRLINDMKEQYIKLQTTGDSEDVDDLINMEKIMRISEEVRLGDVKLGDTQTTTSKKRVKLKNTSNGKTTTTHAALKTDSITSKPNKPGETSSSIPETHGHSNALKLELTSDPHPSSDNHQESELEETIEDPETTEEQDTDYSGEDTDYE